MSTTAATAEPSVGQRYIAAVKEQHAAHMIKPGWALLDHRIIQDHDLDVLAFGIDAGLIDRSEITWGTFHWPDFQQLLASTGTEKAWEADQEARSVPLVCPSWCNSGHDEGRLRSAGGVESHVLELTARFGFENADAESSVVEISIDYVSDSAHPDSPQQPQPEGMTLWFDGNVLDAGRRYTIEQLEVIAKTFTEAVAEAKAAAPSLLA